MPIFTMKKSTKEKVHLSTLRSELLEYVDVVRVIVVIGILWVSYTVASDALDHDELT